MSNNHGGPDGVEFDIDSIIGEIRATEVSETICVRGDLLAVHQDLERELRAASREKPSLGERAPAAVIAEKIQAVEEQIRAAQRTFRFRSLENAAFSDLRALHPPRKGHQELWNPLSFAPALLAAAAISPKMTVEQAAALIEKLPLSEANKLFQTALNATQEPTKIPFSAAASFVLSKQDEN